MKHKSKYIMRKNQKNKLIKSNSNVITILALLLNFIMCIIAIVTISISIYSFKISKEALKTADDSLKLSDLGYKSNSAYVEPILNIDIDWNNDTLQVHHETSDVYQIRNVNFGLIRTVAVSSGNKILSVELEEITTRMNLEDGHTTGTTCSKEDAARYNKDFTLSLKNQEVSNWGINFSNVDICNQIEDDVKKRCDNDLKYKYWGVSTNFNYRYIEIYYSDIYGNIKAQYYIYKYEYASSWRLYKLSEAEYLKYISNVIIPSKKQEIEDKLFSELYYNEFSDDKYENFYNWYEPQYWK